MRHWHRLSTQVVSVTKYDTCHGRGGKKLGICKLVMEMDRLCTTSVLLVPLSSLLPC
jgi:hypothetical protein